MRSRSTEARPRWVSRLRRGRGTSRSGTLSYLTGWFRLRWWNAESRTQIHRQLSKHFHFDSEPVPSKRQTYHRQILFQNVQQGPTDTKNNIISALITIQAVLVTPNSTVIQLWQENRRARHRAVRIAVESSWNDN